jgi:hypothetical protein
VEYMKNNCNKIRLGFSIFQICRSRIYSNSAEFSGNVYGSYGKMHSHTIVHTVNIRLLRCRDTLMRAPRSRVYIRLEGFFFCESSTADHVSRHKSSLNLLQYIYVVKKLLKIYVICSEMHT